MYFFYLHIANRSFACLARSIHLVFSLEARYFLVHFPWQTREAVQHWSKTFCLTSAPTHKCSLVWNVSSAIDTNTCKYMGTHSCMHTCYVSMHTCARTHTHTHTHACTHHPALVKKSTIPNPVSPEKKYKKSKKKSPLPLLLSAISFHSVNMLGAWKLPWPCLVTQCELRSS